MRVSLFLILAFCMTSACTEEKDEVVSSPTCLELLGVNTEWSGETEVEIDGYALHAMEPKVSADQVTLFWNDKPATDDQMNVHYAVKQGNGRYLYIGTLPGTVDAASLDGVPAVDVSGNFYFVSLRTYSTNSQTVYGGVLNVVGPNSLSVTSVAAADAAATSGTPGVVDMDIDISWDGSWMIASRASFSGEPYPDSSYLVLNQVASRLATSYAQSSEMLKNVNLPQCAVYAATLSNDLKELYYTVFPAGSPNSTNFRIAVSKRNSTSDPFGPGAVITGVAGSLPEGPTISFDDGGKTLFYHKLDSVSGRFKIYKVTRP